MKIKVVLESNPYLKSIGLVVLRRGNPPDERKEGDANVCYIFWFDSVINIHCCPCRSLLRDFQG